MSEINGRLNVIVPENSIIIDGYFQSDKDIVIKEGCNLYCGHCGHVLGTVITDLIFSESNWNRILSMLHEAKFTFTDFGIYCGHCSGEFAILDELVIFNTLNKWIEEQTEYFNQKIKR